MNPFDKIAKKAEPKPVQRKKKSHKKKNNNLRLRSSESPCNHIGDPIPFACYRMCKKCGEFYDTVI